jgi:hypothetical protein
MSIEILTRRRGPGSMGGHQHPVMLSDEWLTPPPSWPRSASSTLTRARRLTCQEPWILLYVERWLG